MTDTAAIRLYRRERKKWEKRNRKTMRAERKALAEAMLRAGAVAPLKLCLCGCGQRCPSTRRTATVECYRKLRAAQNRRHFAKVRGELVPNEAA